VRFYKNGEMEKFYIYNTLSSQAESDTQCSLFALTAACPHILRAVE